MSRKHEHVVASWREEGKVLRCAPCAGVAVFYLPALSRFSRRIPVCREDGS
jgi:hypothetical protein